ncbi:MAG: hypothetical protein US27_C0022G0014 [Candidatus Moranbacteria bacterium GW2011_GWF1_36_78]|nr:MAG: hypothetical protein US27_C0022G0014 [Candidatus Moranbacteria bacterium GW2011_GWF1_36_78]
MNKELLEKIGKVVPEEKLRALLDEWDPIIHVDRTARPVYPDFVKEVKYPELELTGPAEFDVTKLERWLHPKQIGGYATGNEIHEELIAKKMLEGCLNLADLQAIQVKDIGFFRKHSSRKAIPAWKSVVLDRDDHLYVPYLYEYGDGVELVWRWLGSNFHSDDPALRFPQG